MNNYPFKIEDLEIFLTFLYPDGTEVKSGEIDHILISEGMFTYKTTIKETGRLTTLFKETILEAREKVSEKEE